MKFNRDLLTPGLEETLCADGKFLSDVFRMGALNSQAMQQVAYWDKHIAGAYDDRQMELREREFALRMESRRQAMAERAQAYAEGEVAELRRELAATQRAIAEQAESSRVQAEEMARQENTRRFLAAENDMRDSFSAQVGRPITGSEFRLMRSAANSGDRARLAQLVGEAQRKLSSGAPVRALPAADDDTEMLAAIGRRVIAAGGQELARVQQQGGQQSPAGQRVLLLTKGGAK